MSNIGRTGRVSSQWLGLALGASIAALAVASPAVALSSDAVSLSIPAQSLGSALNSLALRSQYQVIVDASLTRGLVSRPIEGTFTIDQALSRMLRGSGLGYRIEGNTLIIGRSQQASFRPVALQTVAPGEQSPVADSPIAAAPQAAAAGAAPPAEIVVTGSRLARAGYSQPTPVNVISSQAIQQSGFSNVSDILNRAPQVGVGLGSASSYYNGDAGASFINLRGLGTNRTLVLVDGRRRVSGTELSSAVDLTTIPANLIDKIEVITGGAAAVYGADAVTGVVNVSLKTHYDGLEISGRSGISEHGDAASRSVGLLFGKSFKDDRGSFVVGASYNSESPLQANQRSFGRKQTDLFGNPANTGPNDGIYDNIAIQNYRYPGTSYGGAFAIGGTSYTYDRNGVRPIQEQSVPYAIPSYVGVGGDGFNDADFAPLRNKSQVFSSLAHLEYKLTDAIKFYSDVQYARTKTVAPLQPSFDLAITLPIGSPLIPTDVRSLMEAAGQDTLTVGRTNVDQGISKRYITRNTYTAVGGLEGALGSRFNWNAFYQYGRYKADITRTHDRIVSKFNDAVNVIDGPSGPECASATARAAGCQPLDLFGEFAASPDALSYFDYTVNRSVINTQEVAGGQITGKPFDLPAGAVEVAGGVEYRHETLTVHPDPLAAAGQLLNDVDAPVHAGFTVKEVFGEVLVPLLADRPFVKTLSAEGAIRYSDYDTIGHTLAWKAGGQYAPSDDIRFRVTRSKSVRAPNLAELYDPGSSSTSFILDPCDSTRVSSNANRTRNCAALGIPATYTDPFGGVAKTVITGGYSGLKQETSYSWTAGTVITPRAIPGLALSVDWWSIKILNAINVVPLQRLVDNCVDAGSLDNAFCPHIVRRADGAITEVDVTPINVGSLKAEGVDFQASYSHRLASDWFGERPSLRFVVNGTYLAKNDVLVDAHDPTTLDKNAGEVDNPKWRVNATPGITLGRFSLDWTLRYISHTKVDVQASAEYRSDNDVKAEFYNDLYVNFALDKRFELYAGVNNLFDVDPPFSAVTFQGTGRGSLYDNIGRYFFVGATARF